MSDPSPTCPTKFSPQRGDLAFGAQILRNRLGVQDSGLRGRNALARVGNPCRKWCDRSPLFRSVQGQKAVRRHIRVKFLRIYTVQGAKTTATSGRFREKGFECRWVSHGKLPFSRDSRTTNPIDSTRPTCDRYGTRSFPNDSPVGLG